MNTPTLTMMVGLPGSGKSYLAESMAFNTGANIHSSDKLREEMLGDVNTQNANNDIFIELHKRIKSDLISGKSVIYDATNIDYKRRSEFVRQISRIPCKKACIMIATPLSICCRRNEARERTIPEHVIHRMHKNIYIPQYYEGWDEIHIIWTTNWFIEIEKLFNDKGIPGMYTGLCNIPHDNPFHTATIGDHCLLCNQNLKELGASPELCEAGLLHDIGKPFTKSFTNGKGEPTEIAHYYQHHLVSAYESLFCSEQHNEQHRLLIANYIQWHMQPYYMETNHTHEKYKKLWGDAFYNDIMLLHKADEMSH